MEDLVFAAMGIETGVDLEAPAETARWFEGTLGRPLPGMVMKVGACCRRRRRLRDFAAANHVVRSIVGCT